MSKKKMVVDTLTRLLGNKETAEMVVEVLNDEGWLHLGHGDADIDRVLSKFSETYGTTKTSNSDRFAANRLTSKYGAQSVCGIIDMLAAANGQPYAPVVNSVTELENKWVSVLTFVRKNKGSEEIQL